MRYDELMSCMIIDLTLRLVMTKHLFIDVQVEYPIPEQFKTTYNGKGLTTVISETAWLKPSEHPQITKLRLLSF